MSRQIWLMTLSLVAISIFIFACGPQISTTVQTGGPTVQQAITYQGPKARIAVASFKCKAAKCSGNIGDGLADMLSTALFQTGRFVVLERGEGLKAIQEELNLGQSGYVQQGKAPQIGLMEGADILVIGAITAFEPEASGIGGGGVIIPFNVPLIGGAKVGKKEAYIAADIRLVDVRTGRVINATKVEGKASSWNVAGGAGTLIGTVALGGGLGVYKNTPMEKALRVMLESAVQAISQMVPESYYRYGGSSSIGPTPTPMAPSSSTSSSGLSYVSFSSPKIVLVTANKINVRRGPGTNYDIVAQVKKGMELNAIGMQGNWYQVTFGNGKIGWVYKDLVSE